MACRRRARRSAAQARRWPAACCISTRVTRRSAGGRATCCWRSASSDERPLGLFERRFTTMDTKDTKGNFSFLFAVIMAAGIVSLSAQPKQGSAAARDIEGIWNFATLTPFERPAEFKDQRYFTDEQAAKFEADTIDRNDRDRRDGGAATDAARGVGEYWFDRGTRVGTLDGRKPTSWVIDPPDGRVPPMTAAARATAAARN